MPTIRHINEEEYAAKALELLNHRHKVPSNLLDIEQTLPNYEEVIGNIMVDAEKLWTIAEIETITKETKENNHEA